SFFSPTPRPSRGDLTLAVGPRPRQRSVIKSVLKTRPDISPRWGAAAAIGGSATVYGKGDHGLVAGLPADLFSHAPLLPHRISLSASGRCAWRRRIRKCARRRTWRSC